MGSVIGDYIHLHRKNYYTYGTDKTTNDKAIKQDADNYAPYFINYTEQRANNIKRKILAGNGGDVDPLALKELQLVLNSFKKQQLKEAEGTKEQYDAIINNALKKSTKDQVLLKLIQEESNRKASESRFDIDIGSQLKVQGYSTMGSIDKSKDITIAYKKILILENYLIDLIQTYSINNPEYRDILTALSNILQVFNEVDAIVSREGKNEMLSDLWTTGIKLTKHYTKTEQTVNDFLKSKKEDKKAYSALSEGFALIDSYIDTYMGALAVNNAKGLFFEEIARNTPTIATIVANNEISGVFSSVMGGITGQSTESTYYDLNKFKYGGKIGDIVGKGTYEFANTEYKIKHESSGKIDAQLKWQLKDGGRKSLLSISAKNIYGDNFVRIVSGTPLLFFLQNETATFANHFLNIFASQLTMDGKEEEKNNGSVAANNERVMKICIRILFVLMGLTGAVHRRKSANVFLINDNSQTEGGVRAISMNTIIDNIINILDNQSNIGLVGNVFTNGSIKVPFENKFQKGGEEERIAHLWRQLHQQKITTGINQQLLI